MPQLDKTGPEGRGPTGWGRGGCNTISNGPTPRGRGVGRGRGFCPYYQDVAPLSLTEEKKMLESRLADVQKALEDQPDSTA